LKRRGLFITLEGMDGTGKSTQLRLLAKWLGRRGYKLRVTREPGGTRLGERIRRMLLDSRGTAVAPLAELLLMYAARRQHLEEVVRPALDRGELVLSDRFHDASFAYQGYGRQIGEDPVHCLDKMICGAIRPDLTLVLDVPPGLALGRIKKRAGGRHKRYEGEGLKFQERVRRGYLAIAKRQPGRVKVIPANASVAEVQRRIRDAVEAMLAGR
jgi:dTMP kinase